MHLYRREESRKVLSEMEKKEKEVSQNTLFPPFPILIPHGINSDFHLPLVRLKPTTYWLDVKVVKY